MQKTGIAREDTHSQAEPIESEVRKAGIRTRIRDWVGRHRTAEAHEVQLPEKEDIQQSIGLLFTSSGKTQPGKVSNAMAGVADAAFGYSMTFNHPLAILGGIGVIASETVSALKNYRDAHLRPEYGEEQYRKGEKEAKSYSELRNEERDYLKKCEKQIVSELKLKISGAEKDERKEIKKLIKDTEKLFSQIDKESKGHLNTVLRSRLEGFGISFGVAVLNTYVPPFSSMANGFSDYLVSFALVQPVQFQPYNPDLILISIAAKAAWLAFTAAIPTLVACELHNDSKRFESRLEAEQKLSKDVDGIFERIQEVFR